MVPSSRLVGNFYYALGLWIFAAVLVFSPNATSADSSCQDITGVNFCLNTSVSTWGPTSLIRSNIIPDPGTWGVQGLTLYYLDEVPKGLGFNSGVAGAFSITPGTHRWRTKYSYSIYAISVEDKFYVPPPPTLSAISAPPRAEIGSYLPITFIGAANYSYFQLRYIDPDGMPSSYFDIGNTIAYNLFIPLNAKAGGYQLEGVACNSTSECSEPARTSTEVITPPPTLAGISVPSSISLGNDFTMTFNNPNNYSFFRLQYTDPDGEVVGPWDTGSSQIYRMDFATSPRAKLGAYSIQAQACNNLNQCSKPVYASIVVLWSLGNACQTISGVNFCLVTNVAVFGNRSLIIARMIPDPRAWGVFGIAAFAIDNQWKITLPSLFGLNTWVWTSQPLSIGTHQWRTLYLYSNLWFHNYNEFQIVSNEVVEPPEPAMPPGSGSGSFPDGGSGDGAGGPSSGTGAGGTGGDSAGSVNQGSSGSSSGGANSDSGDGSSGFGSGGNGSDFGSGGGGFSDGGSGFGSGNGGTGSGSGSGGSGLNGSAGGGGGSTPSGGPTPGRLKFWREIFPFF